MGFITICENANDDLIEHIIAESTEKFIDNCIINDDEDAFMALHYVIETIIADKELDETIFNYVFESFYNYLDYESMIYESVLFENVETEPDGVSEDQIVKKKNIFKKAIDAVGRGVSKITPNFLKQSPKKTWEDIKEKKIGTRLGGALTAAKNSILNPSVTMANIKTKWQNRKTK